MGAAAVRGRIAELAGGFGSLWRGFSFWRARPGLMLFGLLPALLSGIVLFGGLAALVLLLDPITEALTPFADDWDPFWRTSSRVLLATSLVVTAGILSARVFTALALTLGGPVYERIGRLVDDAYGGIAAPSEPAFWRSIGDFARIVLRSVIGSLVIGLITLIPVVGAVLGPVCGVLFTALIVAREFTLLPLQLRGLDASARHSLVTGSRWRALGFGLGVQLCYLVPLGPVLAMPAAVAGGTHLARRMLGEPVELRSGEDAAATA